MFLKLFSLALLVLLVFGSAARFDFINLDDNVYVTDNPHVQSGLSFGNTKWAFTTGLGGHWHPLTWLSHQLDSELFGLNPFPLHLENILFHTVNTLLLFILLFKLFRNAELAWLFAALFAVHPLRLESVVWIAERKDVLSQFFGLLTLLGYEKFRTGSKKFYVLSLVTFSLGLLAKPSLIILPILFLFMDFWIFHLKNWKNLLAEKIPFFFLAFLSGVATVYCQHQAGALKTMSTLSLGDRLSVSFVGYLGYLGKTFWPEKLAVFYPLIKYPTGIAVGAFLSLVVISVFCLRARQRLLGFGWAWFVVFLFPVIGFLQVGGQALADRWTYGPHIGLAIAGCGLLQASFQKNKKTISGVLIFLIAMAIYKTRLELPHWKNSETLFTHALEVSPDNFLAHTNLGVAQAARGDLKSAQFHYEEALRLNPTYPEALNNIGTLKARRGNSAEAIDFFLRALARNPTDRESRYNLGLAYYELGKKLKAVNEWLSLAISDPEYAPTWQSLNFMAQNDFRGICDLKNQDDEASKGDLEKMRELLKKYRSPSDKPALTQAIESLRTCFTSQILK